MRNNVFVTLIMTPTKYYACQFETQNVNDDDDKYL